MVSLKSQDNNNYFEDLGMEQPNQIKIGLEMQRQFRLQDNNLARINSMKNRKLIPKMETPIFNLDESLKNQFQINKSFKMIAKHHDNIFTIKNQDRSSRLHQNNLDASDQESISLALNDNRNLRLYNNNSHQHLNFGNGKYGSKVDDILLKHQVKIDSIISKNISRKRKIRYSFQQVGNLASPVWVSSIMYDKNKPPEEFPKWTSSSTAFCENRFIAYANNFAKFKDLEINKKFCACKLKGGEMIRDVVNQSEDDEYYTLEMGCFRLACEPRPAYLFNAKSHLNKWMYALSTLPEPEQNSLVVIRHQFTIAIVRYEYANLYHTMTDWYNAFLTMQFFEKTSANTNILIVDAHPHGSLDYVWTNLFNSTFRLSSLPLRTRFTDIAWGIVGYNSLFKTTISSDPPLLSEFRQFFLNSFALLETERIIKCERLKILFIWRKDYLAHPRNPKKKKVPTATLR